METRIVGEFIEHIKVLEPGSVLFNKNDEKLAKSKIANIRRRGKVLIFDLENKHSILFHLKMTGQIIFDGASSAKTLRFAGGHPTKSMVGRLPDKSTRVIFGLSSGSKIYFNDQRKFGWIKILPTEQVAHESLISKMGPEPSELPNQHARSVVKSRIISSSRSIKALILDQKIVAGVGNIYADESLFIAKVHPEIRGKDLDEQKIDSLMDAIVSVMKTSIKMGGTSFTNYVKVDGEKGSYLDKAQVFRREGKTCKRCGTTIRKIRVASRGTHYCPGCQILPKKM